MIFMWSYSICVSFYFFNDTAPTVIYTLSLHDALTIWRGIGASRPWLWPCRLRAFRCMPFQVRNARSEEHTSELQSQSNLVCRLLLEKKKTQEKYTISIPQLNSKPTFHAQVSHPPLDDP